MTFADYLSTEWRASLGCTEPAAIAYAACLAAGHQRGEVRLVRLVCDGAKVGCAMKIMTGVDAAFRAANLALLDMGIPTTDGIVGCDAETSLANLGRLAQYGMATVDAEILAIMQEKLKTRPACKSTDAASSTS